MSVMIPVVPMQKYHQREATPFAVGWKADGISDLAVAGMREEASRLQRPRRRRRALAERPGSGRSARRGTPFDQLESRATARHNTRNCESTRAEHLLAAPTACQPRIRRGHGQTQRGARNVEGDHVPNDPVPRKLRARRPAVKRNASVHSPVYYVCRYRGGSDGPLLTRRVSPSLRLTGPL